MEVAAGITMIDTRLGGVDGVTAAYLVSGASPALVDAGAQTSAATVTAALHAMGLAADDLAWLVMTHVHLDHCGGVGDLALAFPRATVVVHPRGAPHLSAPERLVSASAAVYGDLAPLYGGLRPVAQERLMAAANGTRLSLGGTRELVLLDAPGHARHHMAVLDDATGALMAGDALGVQFPGSGLYPALPPPEFDRDAALETLEQFGAIAPERILLGHFGAVPHPGAALEQAAERQRRVADAAEAAWRTGGPDAVGPAVQHALPLAETVRDPAALERWRWLGWCQNNVTGLTAWLARADRTGAADG